jgi:hypothetical protein
MGRDLKAYPHVRERIGTFIAKFPGCINAMALSVDFEEAFAERELALEVRITLSLVRAPSHYASSYAGRLSAWILCTENTGTSARGRSSRAPRPPRTTLTTATLTPTSQPQYNSAAFCFRMQSSVAQGG